MGVGGRVMGELDEAVAAWQRVPLAAPYCVRWALSIHLCETCSMPLADELNSAFNVCDEKGVSVAQSEEVSRGCQMQST